MVRRHPVPTRDMRLQHTGKKVGCGRRYRHLVRFFRDNVGTAGHQCHPLEYCEAIRAQHSIQQLRRQEKVNLGR